MEYIQLNPVKITKKYKPVRFYGYNFLDTISHNLSTECFYLFLNHLDEYKLKNVWNSIAIHWIKVNNSMRSKDYNDSIYSKQKYNHIHVNIGDKKLNECLVDFIDNDPFKALFASICIARDFHL
mgnify:FL=1